MLTLCKVILEATGSVSNIAALHGRYLHALVYGRLRMASAGQATALHTQMQQKPFALSPLQKPGGIYFQPGECLPAHGYCYFTICVWQQAVLEGLQAALCPGDAVHLAGVPFVVREVDVVQTVTSAALSADGMPSPCFTIRFDTPTFFKSSGRALLFPEPRLVFGGLALQHAAAFGAPVERELLQTLYDDTVPVHYQLRTQKVSLGDFVVTGFTGSCDYRVDRTVPADARQAAHRLLAMIPYVGIGAKTAMALGRATFRYYRQ